jgi:secreted trypsin-like serine protease
MQRFALMIALLTHACRTPGTASDLTLVGGSHASSGQFPAVMIWAPGDVELTSSYCTGAKVGKRFILTAAHCVLEQEPKAGQEYIGPWRRLKSLGDGKSIRFSQALLINNHATPSQLVVTHVHWHPHVERCITDVARQTHKDCSWRTPLPDIALIEVEPTPTFDDIPAATPSTEIIEPNLAITMLGYGAQGEDDNKSPRLKFHQTTVATDKELEAALAGTEAERDGPPKMSQFFGTMGIIAGQGHANLGSGDSGGPVFRNHDGRIIGVNSDGFCPLSTPKCERTTNSFFARIDDAAPYHVGRWLAKILKNGD